MGPRRKPATFARQQRDLEDRRRGAVPPRPPAVRPTPLPPTDSSDGFGGFAEGILEETPPAPPPPPAARRDESSNRENAGATPGNGTAGQNLTDEAGAADGQRPRRRRGRRGGRRHRRREQRDMDTAAEASADSVQDAEDAAGENAVIETPPARPGAPKRGIVEPEDGEPAELVAEGETLSTESPSESATRSEGERTDGRGRRRGRRGGRGRGGRDRRRDDEIESRETDDDGEEITVDGPDVRRRAEPAADVEDELDDDVEATGGVVVRPITEPHRSMVRDGREMLINVADADECRIAMLLSGRLDELYMERVSSASHVGNIYKGRVTNVEPSIQAAFVDFGLTTHGFLHISDLHPKYFPNGGSETEQVGRKTPRRERPPIQRCLRRGQEVIVQITKEGIGTKGPTLTTYISVPGRFLVMMPDMNELGVSRKIEDEETRRELRTMLSQLSLPTNFGFIMRTAAIGRTKRDLQRDLTYLLRLWKSTEDRIRNERAPCVLYQESDLVIRTIRDVFDADVKRIVCDHLPTAERIAEFLSIASPKSRDSVFHYTVREPLFHLFNIEAEIEKLHSKHVPLPCGGSLVIESTEALVAIDVNSGRFRVPDDPDETARRVNLEAAEEIARQLRLRDLGGLIICDFIDMRLEKNKRSVERRLRDALKHHKERAKLLKMSRFGIIEMTRQRQRPSISRSVYQDCPRCRGTGMVKTPESVTLDVMRAIAVAAQLENVAIIDVQLSIAVGNHLLNRKRRIVGELEHDTGRTIIIRGIEGFAVDEVRYSCTDRRGREIPFTDVHAVLPTAGPGGRAQAAAALPGGGPAPRVHGSHG